MGFRCERRAGSVAAIAAIALPGSVVAQDGMPERIAGQPNLNGVWQAATTAYWNLEAHSAEKLDEFWALGALAAIPAGRSVVEGGTIPYRADALEVREANRAGWPETDPAAKCYMPGIPRATYQPYPFQIVQGDGDILFAYEFASANRTVYMDPDDHLAYEDVPVDQWMGWSNGRWEDDTLVVEVVANDSRTWLDRAGNYHSSAMTVTERYRLVDANHIQYEATIEDPEVFTRPWTISMPLYRRVEPNADILEFKCVEFAENLLYGELLREPPPE